MFIDLFVLCFNHRRIPTESFPQNVVKIQLDLAEILRISKLDWNDGGGKKEEKGRSEGILLCNGLIPSVYGKSHILSVWNKYRRKTFPPEL